MGVITFAGDEKDGGTKETYAEIRGVAHDPGQGSANKGHMSFFVQAAGALTETMTLDENKVGIGTSSPDCLVEMTGAHTSSIGMLHLDSTDHAFISLDAAGASNDKGIYFQEAGTSVAIIDHDGSANQLRIHDGSSTHMVVNDNGRVGIGSISPGQRLLVSDDANDNTVLKVQNSGNSTPYGQIIEFSGAAPDDNTRYFLRCGDTGANRMHIYSDGDVNTSDAGTLTSDRSLKTDIEDATSKLADINQLQVRNFKWITDYHPNKQNKHIGFIADEFETVFPSLVVEHENPIVGQDGTVKSVRYGALIPILVKALQEADDKIDALEARITALES